MSTQKYCKILINVTRLKISIHSYENTYLYIYVHISWIVWFQGCRLYILRNGMRPSPVSRIDRGGWTSPDLQSSGNTYGSHLPGHHGQWGVPVVQLPILSARAAHQPRSQVSHGTLQLSLSNFALDEVVRKKYLWNDRYHVLCHVENYIITML